MLRITVIVSGVLLSFAASAQSIRLKHYLNPENERFRNLNLVYLAGAVDALTAYNTATPAKLFCTKEGEIVSHEEADRLLTDWAKNQTNELLPV